MFNEMMFFLASVGTECGYAEEESCRPIPPPNPPDNDLPFTGLEIWIIVAVAIVCIIAGLWMRHQYKELNNGS